MNSLTLAVPAIVVLSCLASAVAAAQQPRLAPVPQSHSVNPNMPLSASTMGVARVPQSHAVNPSMSLSAPANSPLQAQMREDYATGLRGAQRNLLQQNPSGLTPDQLAIGHELNGYMGPR
jgi:hypothetical protein